MPKTYRIPHYLVEFETGSPKTKGFDERDDMLRFLASTKRNVISHQVNGRKQAPSLLKSLKGIAKAKYPETEKRDFSQIALAVVEKATGQQLLEGQLRTGNAGPVL